MTFIPPPRGLRVLLLRDRLILHDISFAFRSHPYDRNALIDAANSVHHRQQSSTKTDGLIDLDLPTHPAHTSNSSPQHHNSYLVVPFAPENAPYAPPTPYQASSPEQAGMTKSTDFTAVPVDAAAAFLGLLPLHSAVFAVLATQVRRAGTHPTGPILAVSKVRLVRLGEAWLSKEDKDTASAVAKLLESGSLCYSIDSDLTIAAQRRGQEDKNDTFCWNSSLARRLPQDLRQWTIRAVYGFVGTHIMRFQSDSFPSGMAEFSITVISRRSRLRAGTRYITRGVDALGNVANSVETEQIIWREEQKHLYASFIVIRGSVPVYWRQNNGIAKPSPELDDGLVASRRAFARHFDALKDRYGHVAAVSLVDKHGSESVLANAFEQHFELYLKPFERLLPPKLVAFDFHSHCSGKEYERGLALLLDRLRADISRWGFYLSTQESTEPTRLQKGVFRVNCVDCLDRTNVVQSMIARVVLSLQLEEVFRMELSSAPSKYGLRLYTESEDRYKHLWGDNADAVSKQYSGTGALKTDFTRTGRRSTTGVIGDGMKSVMRMYYKNFVDEGRQEVIDVLCGNVSMRQPASPTKDESTASDQLQRGNDLIALNHISSLRKSTSKSTSLWYSFEALRINAGGDKQPVFVELHDDVMNVVTPDGIALDFPRNTLVSWSKRDDGKPSDRKVTPAKLRLIYNPFHSYPATTSPLDLQFKGGTTARENFLRALISWSHPETASLLARKPVRVRVISLLSAGEHRMSDWGLAPEPDAKDVDEIIALVLPTGNEATRSWGLAAVPVDVDFSDYVLVGACAANEEGPSIAVLSSKRIVPTVMMVSETTTKRTSSSFGGGAAAIALQAGGTSFCFVSARANGLTDLHAALASLKVGRQSFDVTSQFHHFTVAGLLGDTPWPRGEQAGKMWVELGDGSSSYALENGLSVMRTSFPTLMYNDKLNMKSRREAKAVSARKGESVACTVLEDGVVEGRTGPQLPRNIAKSVVSVTNLRAEDVMTPRGVEQTSQMNCAVVLYCDLATMDGVATRPTQRPSSYPEWRETLSLFMMPSDIDEIYDSFILGQIVIPMPLGDPIPAGNFVLPIAFAQENNGDFEVPCRLAGKQTARLSGSIRVRDGDWDVREGTNLSMHGTDLPSGGLVTSSRNSLPPIPTYVTNGGGGNGGSDRVRRRPHGTASPTTDGLQTQTRKKGAIEEMNGKLNAARRQGSKQMKFVVNRLSSLLNQPSSSSNTPPVRASRTMANPDAEIEDELCNVDIKKEVSNYKPHRQRDLSAFNACQNFTGQATERVAVQKADASLQSGGSKNVSPASFGKKDEAGLLGSFQAAPSGYDYRERNGNTSQKSDPLLQALQGVEKSRSGATSESTNPPTHFNEGRLDSLLSGLAQEKDKSSSNAEGVMQDEDEWGDFESAATPALVVPPKGKHRSSSRSGSSLLDF